MSAEDEEDDNGAPSWLLSFADMVTAMVACFVMLLSLASEQIDDTLFKAGQGSFRRAIQHGGVPAWLLGKAKEQPFDYKERKYPTKDESEHRRPKVDLRDAHAERIRKAFNALQRRIETRVGDLNEELLSLQPAPVDFAGDRAELGAEDRRALKRLAVKWKQTRGSGMNHVYVMALPLGNEGAASRWMLAARRAAAVRDVLQRAVGPAPGEGGIRVSAWGGGAYDPWFGDMEAISRENPVVIAMTKPRADQGD